MKSIVIYFSMTGGTKKIAEAIHAGMIQSGEQCNITRIKDVRAQDLVNYDLIGIGGPVIRLRETPNITNLIELMYLLDGKHGFAFCTHGAFPADFLARVVPAMAQRGLVMIGWNDWFSSVFHPGCPKPYFTDGHPDAIDLKEAEDWGKVLVERSRSIYAGETQLIPTFPRGQDYDNIYNLLRTGRWPRQPQDSEPEANRLQRPAMANIESVSFEVNKDNCNYPECTLCIDNCPMGAIDFAESPPLFSRECIRCYQCEMTCPTGAIEFDWGPFMKSHVVSPGSGLEKSIELFEAQGRFRRLVPLEDVGFDTPFASYKKPRYKIV